MMSPVDRSLAGSSPLARGLPAGAERPAGSPGIIPARAGFTIDHPYHWSPPRDHPRSRGVYAPDTPVPANGLGSSPLARGLRVGAAHPAHTKGIIPARAGFTGRRAGRRARRADHPRSRGVYVSGRLSNRASRGSSPLARGLRPRPGGGLLLRRIIPARAGFTHRPPTTRWAAGDHPRSRGVYCSPTAGSTRRRGSSPLARGLLGGRPAPAQTPGIIPARAGFTVGGGAFPLPAGDHPRSRGVYRVARRVAFVRLGSSPLARGLRSSPAPRTSSGRDHPRSRGVYETTWTEIQQKQGSSPLARGLLGPGRLCSSAGGIIPARAGFTVRHIF